MYKWLKCGIKNCNMRRHVLRSRVNKSDTTVKWVKNRNGNFMPIQKRVVPTKTTKQKNGRPTFIK